MNRSKWFLFLISLLVVILLIAGHNHQEIKIVTIKEKWTDGRGYYFNDNEGNTNKISDTWLFDASNLAIIKFDDERNRFNFLAKGQRAKIWVAGRWPFAPNVYKIEDLGLENSSSSI